MTQQSETPDWDAYMASFGSHNKLMPSVVFSFNNEFCRDCLNIIFSDRNRKPHEDIQKWFSNYLKNNAALRVDFTNFYYTRFDPMKTSQLSKKVIWSFLRYCEIVFEDQAELQKAREALAVNK